MQGLIPSDPLLCFLSAEPGISYQDQISPDREPCEQKKTKCEELWLKSGGDYNYRQRVVLE